MELNLIIKQKEKMKDTDKHCLENPGWQVAW